MIELRRALPVSAFAVLGLWLTPLAWVAVNAFVPTAAFVGGAPFRLTFENFALAFDLKDWLAAWTSSAVTATLTTLGALGLAVPCAYAIARWPARAGPMMGLLIGTRILPPASTIVAYLVIGARFHLLNTWTYLVLAGLIAQVGWITAILALTLMPYAASLEPWLISCGASPVRAAGLYVFARSRRQILVLGILCWLFQWGEFFYGATLTGGGRSQTVSVVIAGFSTGQDIQWGPMFAACLLGAAPVVVAMVVSSTLFSELLRRLDKRDNAVFLSPGGPS